MSVSNVTASTATADQDSQVTKIISFTTTAVAKVPSPRGTSELEMSISSSSLTRSTRADQIGVTQTRLRSTGMALPTETTESHAPASVAPPKLSTVATTFVTRMSISGESTGEPMTSLNLPTPTTPPVSTSPPGPTTAPFSTTLTTSLSMDLTTEALSQMTTTTSTTGGPSDQPVETNVPPETSTISGADSGRPGPVDAKGPASIPAAIAVGSLLGFAVLFTLLWLIFRHCRPVKHRWEARKERKRLERRGSVSTFTI